LISNTIGPIVTTPALAALGRESPFVERRQTKVRDEIALGELFGQTIVYIAEEKNAGVSVALGIYSLQQKTAYRHTAYLRMV
jgi:hypothetical protein